MSVQLKKSVFLTFLLVFFLVNRFALAHPGRIISLTPSTTEMLFAIGAGPFVVAVTTADEYPPLVKKLPKVGGVEIDEERILSLKPDLVAGEEDLAGGHLLRLQRLGIKILALHTKKLRDIPVSLEALGNATGFSSKAEREARNFVAALHKISNRWKNSSRPRVFIELGNHPLLTTGKKTFLADMINFAGGENIADTLPEGFQMISEERVVESNPQVIITADGEDFEKISKREGWGGVSAVAGKKIFSINPDLVMRPVPRSIEGLSKIAAWLHAQ